MTRLISILVVLVLAVMLVSTSMFVVDQNRYAVVYALGELREVIREPGLHFKLPPPFQNVVYLDKRLQTLETASDDRFLTQEKKDLLVDSFVKWKIADPHQYLVAVGGNADRGGERIAQVVHTVLGAELARHSVQEVVSSQREQIGDAVRARVAIESRRLGVDVLDLRIRRVDYVDPVTASVLERMKADRLREASELRAAGVAEAEQIRTDAELQRTTILAEAQRQAQTIQGEGDAKASQLYAQSFGKNPEFYRFYRSMEAYRATFKNRSDVLVLDSNSEFFKYFKNPGSGK
jgi:membrane protease subunit HflC